MATLRLAWLSVVRRGAGLALVVFPTAVLFGVVTLFLGMQSTMRDMSRPGLDERVVRVGSRRAPFTHADLERLSHLPHVTAAAPVVRAPCMSPDVINGRKAFCVGTNEIFPTFQQNVAAVPPDAIERWWKVRNGIIVGKEIADRYGWAEGKTITLPTAKGDTAEFVVSYVATQGSNLDVVLWIHADYAEDIRGKRDQYEPIWLVVDEEANARGVMAAVDEMFKGGVFVFTYATVLARQRGESAIVIRIYQAAGLISLLVVLFTALAVLTLSLEERRVSLATLRAVGFKRPSIIGMIVTESALLLVPGAVLGAGAAYAAFHSGLKVTSLINVRITPVDALLVVALGAVLGALMGLFPAMRAARADVVTALRGGA